MKVDSSPPRWAVVCAFVLLAGCRSTPSPPPEAPVRVAVPAAPSAPPKGPTFGEKAVAASSNDPADVASNTCRDPRDGRVYRVVRMGPRLWFAENLKLAVPGSYCYDDRALNCGRYGRLYQWAAAMQACPNGWHLPTEEEWQSVEDTIDGTIAPLLQGGSTGFDILMAGARSTNGSYQDLGTNFYFWSSTTLGDRARLRWNLTDAGLQIATDVKTEAYSVRCVQDR
jgi:uncharacterized protein (TIGR02145 family)